MGIWGGLMGSKGFKKNQREDMWIGDTWVFNEGQDNLWRSYRLLRWFIGVFRGSIVFKEGLWVSMEFYGDVGEYQWGSRGLK